jgi:ATP-binding cassette, subfamily B, multidrug efflux pump
MLKGLTQYPFIPEIRRYRRRYIIGLVSLVSVDLINVLLPLAVREAVDAFGPRNFHRVVWAGVLYFVLMAVQAWGRYLWRMYLIGSSHLIAQHLRLRLYDHLQRLPLNYYQKVRAGDLMSRATNDIESVRMAVGPGILVTVDAALMFLFIIPVMFYLSPKLAALAFAFYPLVPWITARLGDKIDELFESLQVKMSKMSAYAQESFGAIRLIKSLVQERRVYERFKALSRDYEAEGLKLNRYQAIFSPSLTLLTNFGTFLILLMGGMDVMHGIITVGTFVAFQRFVVQLSWPMEAIGWAVTMNKEGVAAYRRLNEILTASEVNSTLPGDSYPFSVQRLLNVQDLKYRYDGLEGFSLDLTGLTLERGQKIGIVGPVGSGKTTFFNLLLRLYEPPPGTLFFEGQDVRGIPLMRLRQRIASVEQQIVLFSEQVKVNVALGRQGRVSESEIEKAARVASVYEEVLELPEGFSTELGERGVNLSGGQKQRIALTRALVRNPELLILDDCFAAVDVDIENKIIENFFGLYPHLSVCFASHRLSVMPRMDEIWLIDQGVLIAKGTHDSLLRGNHLYQALWEKSERQIERERFDPLAAIELTK